MTYIRHWRTIGRVIFIETPVFTRRVTSLLTDDAYRRLQQWMASNPDAGDLIKGGGGIRKVRWMAGGGRGKSSGIRVIYFWRVAESQILMLYLFSKNERSDLTPAQVKQLRKLAKELG